MNRTKLDDGQMQAALADHPKWSQEDGKISRTYEFPSYARGILFVNAVALIAEGMDHHPDLQVGYQKVTVSVSTHDAEGITALDFELARRIDCL